MPGEWSRPIRGCVRNGGFAGGAHQGPPQTLSRTPDARPAGDQASDFTVLNVPHNTLAKLIRLGGRIVRYLPVKSEA
jgi:hypothetical protein